MLFEGLIEGLGYEEAVALKKDNTYRPHFNLKGLTPMAYIKLNYPEVLLSHS